MIPRAPGCKPFMQAREFMPAECWTVKSAAAETHILATSAYAARPYVVGTSKIRSESRAM